MSIKDHLVKRTKHGDCFLIEKPMDKISFQSTLGEPEDNWFELNIPSPTGEIARLFYYGFSLSKVTYKTQADSCEELGMWRDEDDWSFTGDDGASFGISVVKMNGSYSYGSFYSRSRPGFHYSLTEDEAMAGIACITGSADKYFQTNSVSDVNITMQDVINGLLRARPDADS